jgi:hypothetical protein
VNQPVLWRCTYDDTWHFRPANLNRGGAAAVPVDDPEPAALPRHPERLEHAVLPDALGEAVKVIRGIAPHILGIRLNGARIDQH